MNKHNYEESESRTGPSERLRAIHRNLAFASEKDAKQAIEKQSENQWAIEHGQELVVAEANAAELKSQRDREEETRDALILERKNTKPTVSGKKPRDEPGSKKSGDRRSQFSVMDLVTVIILSFAAIACVCLGYANVFANLLASGSVVFTEREELAASLAFLLPIGTLAVKQAVSFFDFDRSKKCYTMVIFSLTLLSLMAWTILFACEFPGVNSGVDVGDLLSGSTGNPWLVWTQLLTEMLAGSALFLAIERICLKYNPDYRFENPDYLQINRKIERSNKTISELTARLAELEGRIARLRAERQVFITHHVTALMARRSLLDQAHADL